MIIVDDAQSRPYAFTRSYWLQRRNALTSRLFQLYNKTGKHRPVNFSSCRLSQPVHQAWLSCLCHIVDKIICSCKEDLSI